MTTEIPAAIFVVLMVSGSLPHLFADPAPPPAGSAGTPAPASSSVPAPAKKFLSSDDDDEQTAAASTRSTGRSLFGLLDSRSSDGKEFFPDPFLGPEFDRETQIEVDYAHGETRNQQASEAGAQVEWNFLGQFTLAGEFGYDSEHAQTARGGTGGLEGEPANARGFENVDLAAFHPIYQFVSRGEMFDYTAVLRLDVGIPTRTPVSGTDVQLTPYVGNLLRLGEHGSVEAWTGVQFTIAPHQSDYLIYGASFGYRITRSQVALPLTKTVTPLLELDGQQPFSNRGRDALFGVAGLNWQFTALGEFQPRISVGYQFPVDRGARDQLRWGIVTQMFFDF